MCETSISDFEVLYDVPISAGVQVFVDAYRKASSGRLIPWAGFFLWLKIVGTQKTGHLSDLYHRGIASQHICGAFHPIKQCVS